MKQYGVLLRSAVFAAVVSLGVPLTGLAESPALPSGTDVVDSGNIICPISGKPVNAKYTTVYQGKKYAFCCPNCAAKFEKDPEKYLAKLGGGV